MDKEQLSALLDRTYELEGLIHLALARDDDPNGLVRLIRAKVDALALTAATVTAAQPTADPGASLAEEPEPEERTPVAEGGEEDPGPEEPYDDEETYDDDEKDAYDDEEDYDDEECDDEELDEDIPPQFMAALEPYIGGQPGEDPESKHNPESKQPEQPRTLNDEAAPKAPSVNDMARGRLVFNLNDRFRFRRSLFGGDDAAFVSALAEVAAMDSYDEAEDHFYGNLQWEPGNAEVKDFMNAVKRYFEP